MDLLSSLFGSPSPTSSIGLDPFRTTKWPEVRTVRWHETVTRLLTSTGSLYCDLKSLTTFPPPLPQNFVLRCPSDDDGKLPPTGLSISIFPGALVDWVGETKYEFLGRKSLPFFKQVPVSQSLDASVCPKSFSGVSNDLSYQSPQSGLSQTFMNRLYYGEEWGDRDHL